MPEAVHIDWQPIGDRRASEAIYEQLRELITSGTPNIVCIQPFACLPNHVVGKAVIKELRRRYPNLDITSWSRENRVQMG